jgi:hypothetical protein
MISKTTLLFAVAVAAAATLAGADPAPTAPAKPETFLNVADAGRDYRDQGEYVNDWGGAQVIALGADRFRLVSFKGGLPGAGWDKETRREIEGKREGDKIRLAGAEGYQVEIADGTVTITTANGGPYTMKKTERTSPTIGAKPPAGAVVLFDGKNADEWVDGHLDGRGYLAAGCKTKKKFRNYQFHCEFLLPFKPLGRGQDRGNSGVYMQDRYEVQVLDSFGLKGEDNECGGIYTKAKPAENLCFPPLVWQTYDLEFQAAKFDAAGKKTANAVLTARHNGVVIHDRLEINGPTGGGQPETPEPGPIQLQGHGNPVFYRNIWIVEK